MSKRKRLPEPFVISTGEQIEVGEQRPQRSRSPSPLGRDEFQDSLP
jgi:hypothetical protein